MRQAEAVPAKVRTAASALLFFCLEYRGTRKIHITDTKILQIGIKYMV